MNFLDLQRQDDRFWTPAMNLIDTVLTVGIDDTYTRAEREMIFAYCSKINGCTFCATRHYDFAIDLGFDQSFNDDDYYVFSEVANNTAYNRDDYNHQKMNNIRYIAAAAKMINSLVSAFGVSKIDDNDQKLQHTQVKLFGYSGRL